MVKVTCLGSAGTVTGANFLVENSLGKKMLVDCGMFQGGKRMELRNWREWDFDPAQIKTLFLTHAHIDHSGRIPKLVRDGFRGRIFTTSATAQLCGIMLLDSAHVQEMDARWQSRRNKRIAKGEIQPLYTMEDAQNSLRYLVPMESDEIFDVEDGIRARLRNAGHILGSSILELWVKNGEQEIKIVFSGDIGKSNQLILKDPTEIFTADYLFVESTYGNRLHKSFDESKAELLEAINYAVSHGEKVIIPAFAVERTQEIIYILSEFHRQGKLPDIPVYLDSPLAIKATEIFKQNKKYYDEETAEIVKNGNDPFSLPNLHYTETTEESMAINERRGSAIVIAGNGMCTAGRIKHHLKHNLWREGASIVIAGFQANGSTGRKIVEGYKTVKVFGNDVAVKARVFTIGGFSAHADQNDLLEWVGNFTESKPKVFIVHGEAEVCEEFAGLVNSRLGLQSYVPRWRENLILKPKEFIAQAPAVAEVPVDLRSDMMGVFAGIERQISMLKGKIEKEGDRARVTDEDIDRLKYIQEELNEILAS
jgi:metallo-beta-lactamase family protein